MELNLNFQPYEIRDENDEILQEGVYGKYTPLTTPQNYGTIDIIGRNLQYLYENQNSVQNMQVNVENYISQSEQRLDQMQATVDEVAENITGETDNMEAIVNAGIERAKQYADQKLSETVASVNTTIGNIQDNVNQTIGVINEQIGGIENGIADELSDIRNNIDEQINAVNDNFNNAVDTAYRAISDLNTDVQDRIDAMETSVASTVSRVDGELSNFESVIDQKVAVVNSKLDNDLADAEARIDSKLQTALDDLDDTVNDINGDIATLEARLGDRITDARTTFDNELERIDEEVTERLDTVEIDTLASIDALKGEYQTAVSNLDTTLSQKVLDVEDRTQIAIDDLEKRIGTTNADVSTLGGILSNRMENDSGVIGEITTNGSSLQIIAGKNDVELISPALVTRTAEYIEVTYPVKAGRTYGVATRAKGTAFAEYATFDGVANTGINGYLSGEHQKGSIISDYVKAPDGATTMVVRSYYADGQGEQTDVTKMVTVATLENIANTYISAINMGNGTITLDGKFIHITGDTVFDEDVIIKGSMTAGEVAIQGSGVLLDKDGLSIELSNGSKIVYNEQGQHYIDSHGNSFAGIGRFMVGTCKDGDNVNFETPWDILPNVILVPMQFETYRSSGMNGEISVHCRPTDVTETGFHANIYTAIRGGNNGIVHGYQMNPDEEHLPAIDIGRFPAMAAKDYTATATVNTILESDIISAEYSVKVKNYYTVHKTSTVDTYSFFFDTDRGETVTLASPVVEYLKQYKARNGTYTTNTIGRGEEACRQIYRFNKFDDYVSSVPAQTDQVAVVTLSVGGGTCGYNVMDLTTLTQAQWNGGTYQHTTTSFDPLYGNVTRYYPTAIISIDNYYKLAGASKLSGSYTLKNYTMDDFVEYLETELGIAFEYVVTSDNNGSNFRVIRNNIGDTFEAPDYRLLTYREIFYINPYPNGAFANTLTYEDYLDRDRLLALLAPSIDKSKATKESNIRDDTEVITPTQLGVTDAENSVTINVSQNGITLLTEALNGSTTHLKEFTHNGSIRTEFTGTEDITISATLSEPAMSDFNTALLAGTHEGEFILTGLENPTIRNNEKLNFQIVLDSTNRVNFDVGALGATINTRDFGAAKIPCLRRVDSDDKYDAVSYDGGIESITLRNIFFTSSEDVIIGTGTAMYIVTDAE